MEIVLIRHGESLGNVKKILQTPDEELTSQGIKQAKNLKNELENLSFDLVFSSNMKRARDTANIIFEERSIPILYVENLEEKRNGDFEGFETKFINWEEINKQPFEEKRLPNGETLLEVKQRALDFLKFIKELNSNRIAVVSHGTIMRVILSIVMEITMEEIIMDKQLKNCSLTTIVFENGKFKVKDLNK